MKNTRIAAIVGGLALAASLAVAPAASADTVGVTSLPAEVTIQAGGSVSVNVPNAKVCATGATNLKISVAGKQDAVVPLTAPGSGCSAGQLNYTISDNPNSLKRNAVVKFTADKPGGKGRIVQTLVIHIAGDQQAIGQQSRTCKDHGHNTCLLQGSSS